LPKAWRRVRTAEQRTARTSRRIRTLVRRVVVGKTPPDPVASARLAGLRYVNDERTAGIRRIGRQNRFRYVDANGRTISNRAELRSGAREGARSGRTTARENTDPRRQ